MVRDQGDKQLERIKGVNGFYSGSDKEIKELENRTVKEIFKNITDEEKVFNVKISDKPFNINKYTNLAYFGNLSFNGTTSIEKAEEQQKNINYNQCVRKKLFQIGKAIQFVKRIKMVRKPK